MKNIKWTKWIGILVMIFMIISCSVINNQQQNSNPYPSQDALTVAAVYAAWQPNTAYKVGDLVTYNNENYQCIQAHTSLTGWEPPNVPALWKDIGAASGSASSSSSLLSSASSVNSSSLSSSKSSSAPVSSGSMASGPATGVPGTPNLSQSDWNGNPNYTITMNMWWGNNGTVWELYENSVLISSQNLVDNSPNAQTASFSLTGKAKGTYTYTTRLINRFGATSGNTLVITVTQGGGSSAASSSSSSSSSVVITSSSSSKASVSSASSVSVGPLPKHILTGYWQNFNNGAKVLRISDVPTSYDLIIVAFADATSTPGAVTFNLDSTLGFSQAQFIADIVTVKARGQHVILSVGGQNGVITVNDSASAANFAASVNALMSQYGFEGVDIDFENGLNATYMAQALRSVKSGSIITLAPQTIDMQSTSGTYFQLALNIKDILTVCNMQYYNSGSMLGYDGKVYSEGNVDFLTALATIQLENGLAPGQVGLGLPASPSAAGSGYVDPSIVNNALDCLASGINGGSFKPPHTYPSIRGAMTWSINWDASNGYNFANTVRAKLNTLP